MTVLEWGKAGDRRYETGIDRGVLYLPEGGAVPWNGLTSVSEKLGQEVKQYYIDGVQYLAQNIPGSYSSTVQAFTYPDELDELLGISEQAPGVFVHDQNARIFDLTYRTLIGNELEGTDHAYKIHVLYNVIATASDRAYSTLSRDLSAAPFEWNLVGTASPMYGIRPTSHISLDSRRLSANALRTVEETIYGSPDVDPRLPDLFSLIELVEETP